MFNNSLFIDISMCYTALTLCSYCVIDDWPHGFEEKDWDIMMRDDEALLRASRADWVLVPHTTGNKQEVSTAVLPTCRRVYLRCMQCCGRSDVRAATCASADVTLAHLA